MADWKKTLNDYGFSLYEKCNCHGAYTEKYMHADKVFKVHAVPSKRLFNLHKHGFFQQKAFLYQIEKTLIDYEITIKDI